MMPPGPGEKEPLRPLLAPRSVAVLGANEKPGSAGRAFFANLLRSPFGGTVYPIHHVRPNVMGVRAYSTIVAVPEKIDLAIVATPTAILTEALDDCIAAGVQVAILAAADYWPRDRHEGENLLAQARAAGLRLLGPNCLGVIVPALGLNATYAETPARAGNIAFLTQSGALGCAVLDWCAQREVGFSLFASLGDMLDLALSDFLDYLAEDPSTQGILLDVESLGDARAFLSAARAAALSKPIIAMKAGRAPLFTRDDPDAPVGSSRHDNDAVIDAALRRAGILRVDSLDDLFDIAELLGKQPRPRGPRLTVLSNAASPALLATDALVSGGGQLTTLAASARTALRQKLGARPVAFQPLLLQGEVTAEHLAQTLDILVHEPNSLTLSVNGGDLKHACDGLLLIVTPPLTTLATAERLCSFVKIPEKPILICWMGGADMSAAMSRLEKAGIPTYLFPDDAARAFNAMWRFTANLAALYETPHTRAGLPAPDSGRANTLIENARTAEQRALNDAATAEVLALYGIFPSTFNEPRESSMTNEAPIKQKSPQQLVATENEIPLQLRLETFVDPQFGPVLQLSFGGDWGLLLQRRATALPPLNTTLAQRCLEQLRLSDLGKPYTVGLDALADLLARCSLLLAEQPGLQRCLLDPLWLTPTGLVVAGAVLEAHSAQLAPAALPRLAIRPYPAHYVTRHTLRDGTEVTVRPIRPEDEPLMVGFHQGLSEETVRLRFFHSLKLSRRIAHERLIRVCYNDYDRDLALVVVRDIPMTDNISPSTAPRGDAKPASGQTSPTIMAVARLSKFPGGREAEFALLIHDQCQRQGLGKYLLSRLMEIGRAEGCRVLSAEILPDNMGMQKVCRSLGFTLQRPLQHDSLHARLEL